jgi:hypothetical protein
VTVESCCRRQNNFLGLQRCGDEHVTSFNDTFVATISELLENFRAALFSLVPVAERSMINWSDLDTHDDWENIARVLFDSFVSNPIRSDVGRSRNDLPLPPYDIDVIDLSRNSWIRVDSGTDSLAFVRLLSGDRPFDTVQAVAVSADGSKVGDRCLRPFSEVEFSVFRRSSEGSDAIVREIEADE